MTGPAARDRAPPPPRFARDWCFFLDVDGTLVDIAAHPDAVTVEPATRELLCDLEDAAGGALALVSGRRLIDLDRLFAPTRFACAGQHGAERRCANGSLVLTGGGGASLPGVAAHLRELATAMPGLLVEDKGLTLSVHYRQAPDRADEARSLAARARDALGRDFVVEHGKMVFEIRAGGHDKGAAIAAFMREAPFAGRMPVFIGDDVSDEPGFAAINARGGLSLKVGGGITQARFGLPDAAAVRLWLAAWIAFCRAPQAVPAAAPPSPPPSPAPP